MPEDIPEPIIKDELGLDPLNVTGSDVGEGDEGDTDHVNVDSLLESSTEVQIITLEAGDESEAENVEINASGECLAAIKQEVPSESDTEDLGQNMVKESDDDGSASEVSTNGSEETKDTEMSGDESAGDAANFDCEEDGAGGAVVAHESGIKVVGVDGEELEEGSEEEEEVYGWGWLEKMAMSPDDNLFNENMVSCREEYC